LSKQPDLPSDISQIFAHFLQGGDDGIRLLAIEAIRNQSSFTPDVLGELGLSLKTHPLATIKALSGRLNLLPGAVLCLMEQVENAKQTVEPNEHRSAIEIEEALQCLHGQFKLSSKVVKRLLSFLERDDVSPSLVRSLLQRR
jgi:hypothetical protein